MKKILLITVPIIIVLIIIGAIIFFINNNTNYKIEEIGQYKYFKMYENDKYGVIDENGNTLIDAIYDIVYIPNPEKDVFVCYYEYDENTGEYKTKALNKSGEQLFTDCDKVEALVLKDTTNKMPFEKSVLKYQKDGKYGLINLKGKKVTKPIYDSIETLTYKEGTFIVEQDKKFGVINLNGKSIINIKYEKIEADGYYDEEAKSYKAGFIVGKRTDEGYRYGYFNYKGKSILDLEYNEVNRVIGIGDKENIYLVTVKNGKSGLYKNDKIILNNEYEEIEFNKRNQLFAVEKQNKQGIYNIKGEEIIPVLYDTILFTGNNITCVNEEETIVCDTNGKKIVNDNFTNIIKTDNEKYKITIDKDDLYGVCDNDGNVILKNIYQYVEYAFKNYFIVTNDGKVGIVNDEGKSEVDFEYEIIQRIPYQNAFQAIDSKNNILSIFNDEAKKTVTMKNGILYKEENYSKIVSDTERKYIDSKGNVLLPKELFKENKLFANYKDGKWGFIDKDGNTVIEEKYEMVTELNKYGFAGIKQNNLWGVIDETGKIIVEPSYKIDWKEPEFIFKYCRLNFGYGFEYYTSEL